MFWRTNRQSIATSEWKLDRSNLNGTRGSTMGTIRRRCSVEANDNNITELCNVWIMICLWCNTRKILSNGPIKRASGGRLGNSACTKASCIEKKWETSRMGAKANLNSKHKKGKPSEKGGGNGRVVEDEEKPEGEGKSMK